MNKFFLVHADIRLDFTFGNESNIQHIFRLVSAKDLSQAVAKFEVHYSNKGYVFNIDCSDILGLDE